MLAEDKESAENLECLGLPVAHEGGRWKENDVPAGPVLDGGRRLPRRATSNRVQVEAREESRHARLEEAPHTVDDSSDAEESAAGDGCDGAGGEVGLGSVDEGATGECGDAVLLTLRVDPILGETVRGGDAANPGSLVSKSVNHLVNVDGVLLRLPVQNVEMVGAAAELGSLHDRLLPTLLLARHDAHALEASAVSVGSSRHL